MGELIEIQNKQTAMRWHEITGDGWEPELLHGDRFAIVDADTWTKDGIYLFFDLFGDNDDIEIYRATKPDDGNIRLSLDNKKYATKEVSMDWFNQCVFAKAIASFRNLGMW